MLQKYFNKSLQYLSVILILSACKKNDAEIVDVSFTADSTVISKGSTVTFTMGYGADALSFFPGDSGKVYSLSAAANLGASPETIQYIQSSPYVDSFRVDAKSGQSIPASIIAKGTANFSPTVDSCFEFNTTSTTGKDTLTILPESGGFYPPTLNGVAVNNFFNATPDRNLSIIGYFRDAPSTVLKVQLRTRFRIKGIWSGTTDFTVTLPTNRDSIFTTAIPMSTLLTNWINANGIANYGKIEEMQVIVGLPATGVSAYTGKYAIRTIRFSEKGYIAWNTGFNVQYLNYLQPAIYKYTYNGVGEFTATMVATSIGRKQFAPSGYIEERNPSSKEYDLQRQVKQIKIIVK